MGLEAVEMRLKNALWEYYFELHYLLYFYYLVFVNSRILSPQYGTADN